MNSFKKVILPTFSSLIVSYSIFWTFTLVYQLPIYLKIIGFVLLFAVFFLLFFFFFSTTWKQLFIQWTTMEAKRKVLSIILLLVLSSILFWIIVNKRQLTYKPKEVEILIEVDRETASPEKTAVRLFISDDSRQDIPIVGYDYSAVYIERLNAIAFRSQNHFFHTTYTSYDKDISLCFTNDSPNPNVLIVTINGNEKIIDLGKDGATGKECFIMPLQSSFSSLDTKLKCILILRVVTLFITSFIISLIAWCIIYWIKNPEATKPHHLKKTITIILLIVFVLSLIPVLWITRYDHPYRDDYGISTYTRHVWEETHSIWQTIQTAGKMAINHYLCWTGTLSTNFLMRLQPIVFDLPYIWSIYFLIAFFILGYILIFKVLLIDLFKAQLPDYVLITVVFTFISIHFMPSPPQGLFYFVAGFVYLFVYLISLLLLATTIAYIKNERKKLNYVYLIVSIFFSFILGFGNYIMPIPIIAILTLIAAYQFFNNQRKFWGIAVILFVLAVSFIFSFTAPGNSARATHFTSTGIVESIISSFQKSIEEIHLHLDLLTFFILLSLSPILWKLAKKSKFTFRYPLFFVFLTYSFYSSLFTPPFYAMGSCCTGRILNVSYVCFLWLALVNLFYLCGWISLKIKSISEEHKIELYRLKNGFSELFRKHAISILILIVLLFIYASYSVDFDKVLFISAYRSIITGEAQAYHEQQLARKEILENTDESIVILSPITASPYVLPPEGLKQTPNIFPNDEYEKYFRIDSIMLEE